MYGEKRKMENSQYSDKWCRGIGRPCRRSTLLSANSSVAQHVLMLHSSLKLTSSVQWPADKAQRLLRASFHITVGNTGK